MIRNLENQCKWTKTDLMITRNGIENDHNVSVVSKIKSVVSKIDLVVTNIESMSMGKSI